MTVRPAYLAVLVGSGLLWGLGQPFGKIAVSTGYQSFGLVFWQMAIICALMGSTMVLRGRPVRLTPGTLTFGLVVAVLGTVVPGFTFFLAVTHLPAGVMSIGIATVPLFALPIAVALGQDRFSALRIGGLLLGLLGVIVLAAPQGALPVGVNPWWLLVALVGPLFYACESNFVARFGMAGMDPVQALFLASGIAGLIVLPLALASGQFINPFHPWGAAEVALVASALANAVAYAAYVWLAASAGAVFASQSSYIVTGSGVVWAMVILHERPSPWIWAALALMLAGVALVQPRNPVRALKVAL